MSVNVSAVPQSPSALPVKIDFGPTLGMEFVALFLTAIFYGVTLLQTAQYYYNYVNDSARLKAMVAMLCGLNTLSVVLVVYGLYNYFITNFGNPVEQHAMVWTGSTESVATVAIVIIVNGFLLRRIVLLGGNERLWRFVAATMGIWQLLVCALIMVEVADTANLSTSVNVANSFHWKPITASANQSAIDSIITALICYLLYKARSGLRSTDRLVNKIILYVVSSGLITVTLMLMILISYLVSPFNLFYGLVNIILPNAYVNAFLATLNSRNQLKGIMDSTGVTMSIPQFAVPPIHSTQITVASQGCIVEKSVSLPSLESA